MITVFTSKQLLLDRLKEVIINMDGVKVYRIEDKESVLVQITLPRGIQLNDILVLGLAANNPRIATTNEGNLIITTFLNK